MQQFVFPRYVFFESKLSAEKFLSNEINSYVKSKPNSILSFEANEDFLNLYDLIAKKALETQTSYKNVIFFSPSETCPNNVDIFDLTSYNFLLQNFVSKTDLNQQNFYCLFDSNIIQTPNTDLVEFDNYLKQSGDIDILLLTVGDDGSLLINFPQTDLNSKSRIISFNYNESNNNDYINQQQNVANQETISNDKTQSDNKSSAQETTICWATLGLEVIQRSKKIFLLLFGENKSELLSNFFFGNGFDSNLPVSCLRENPNVTVVADLEAAKIVLAYTEKTD